MSLARIVMTASAVVLFSTDAQAQDNGPSFSCSNTDSRSEATICASRRLSRLDRRLAELYEDAREAAGTYRQRRRLRSEQSDWLSQRNDCNRRRSCLRRSYEDRIAVLEALVGGSSDTADNNRDGPSFDCSQARRGAETRICRSRRLSRLDRDMAELFREARDQSLSWRSRRRLIRDQRNWLARRDECGRDRSCLRDAYETHIADLKRLRRDDRPAYQRTAAWRTLCRGRVDQTTRTTCRSERLFRLNQKLRQVYDDALRTAGRYGDRDRVQNDQLSWTRDWNACASNERCQRREYRKRITRLQDRDYLRDRDRPRYKRSAEWRATCRGNPDVTTRTTCNSEELWAFFQELEREYKAVLGSTRRRRLRRRIEQDQVRWSASWGKCSRSVRCQRRSYQARLAQLREGYPDDRPREPESDTGYRGTADWRQICSGVSHAAGRTTCYSEALWRLNRKMSRAYDRTLSWADGYGVRQYIAEDQKRWNVSWRSCGANERCQRRAYRDRTAELKDKAYRLKQRRRGRPREPVQDDDYRRTAKWQSTCRSVSHAAGIATCNTRNLWRLNQRMSDSYKSVLASVSNPAVRARVVQDHVRWNSSWRSCGGNVQCQKQSYRQRINALNDPAYVRRFRKGTRAGRVLREEKEDNTR